VTEKVLEGHIKINIRKLGCEDVKWIELLKDPSSVLALLNFCVLLSECEQVSE
jgi:hypothetical protein